LTAVSLEVRRQSGANTIATIESVKQLASNVQEQLPPGVKLEVIRDQSGYIYAGLHEINLHLVLGSILAAWWCWRSRGAGAARSSPASPFRRRSSRRSA
jgi:multidrug efflux pump subunit AcrB